MFRTIRFAVLVASLAVSLILTFPSPARASGCDGCCPAGYHAILCNVGPDMDRCPDGDCDVYCADHGCDVATCDVLQPPETYRCKCWTCV